MQVSVNAFLTMENGKQELERRKNLKGDISKTNISQDIIIAVKTIVNEGDLREQEVYDFMYTTYFSSLYLNTVESIKLVMSNFKHYTKKELKNFSVMPDNILETYSELYEKSALALPLYKMNKKREYKDVMKNYKMKDIMMGFAKEVYEVEFDKILTNAKLSVTHGKLNQAAMLTISLLSIGEYETVNSIFAHVAKCGITKKFELKIVTFIETIVKAVCKTKGGAIEFKKSEEFALVSEIIEESEKQINIINSEYNKIIDELKESITELENEVDNLKNENIQLKLRIDEIEGHEKIRGKSVVLVTHKNKKKLEDVILKHRPKSVMVFDPFDDQSKMTNVCRNADYVFHMTDNSSHNIFNTLKSINANSILINKSNTRTLEETICAL